MKKTRKLQHYFTITGNDKIAIHNDTGTRRSVGSFP